MGDREHRQGRERLGDEPVSRRTLADRERELEVGLSVAGKAELECDRRAGDDVGDPRQQIGDRARDVDLVGRASANGQDAERLHPYGIDLGRHT